MKKKKKKCERKKFNILTFSLSNNVPTAWVLKD